MEIFSNWIFWVVLAAILFILAIIGYLSESMKKDKKKEEDDKVDNVNDSKVEQLSGVDSTPEEKPFDDFSVMPEVNVTPINEASEVQNETVSEAPVNSAEDVIPAALETLNVSTENFTEPTISSENTVAEPKLDDENKNNNVWNS